MEQIAEAANVSKGLVSRALTDRYGVSNEMRSFIKMKATELGYDFNKIKTKQVRKKKCCLLISSRVLTRESYWQPIIRRMEEELSFMGVEPHYFVHGEKQFSEDEQKKFREDDSCAYVVMSKNLPFLMQELEKKKKPTVVIDPQFHVSTKFMQIKTSNYESSYEAAKYLIDNGLTHILYFGATTFSESFSEISENSWIRYWPSITQWAKKLIRFMFSLKDMSLKSNSPIKSWIPCLRPMWIIIMNW